MASNKNMTILYSVPRENMPVLRIPLRQNAVEIGSPMTGCRIGEPILAGAWHDISWDRV